MGSQKEHTNWMSCWNWDSTIERGKIPANGTQVLNKCNALISKYIPHKRITAVYTKQAQNKNGYGDDDMLNMQKEPRKTKKMLAEHEPTNPTQQAHD